jgi:hypothetical protein
MAGQGDLGVRLAAFDWLSQQVEVHGDVLPRSVLVGGFVFNGKQMHDQPIQLPRSRLDRPDPARLQSRYERFRRAS